MLCEHFQIIGIYFQIIPNYYEHEGYNADQKAQKTRAPLPYQEL